MGMRPENRPSRNWPHLKRVMVERWFGMRLSIPILGNGVTTDDVIRETEHNEFQRLLDLWIPRSLIRPHLQRDGIGIQTGTGRKIFEQGFTKKFMNFRLGGFIKNDMSLQPLRRHLLRQLQPGIIIRFIAAGGTTGNQQGGHEDADDVFHFSVAIKS
jgi:hypothetical protein